MRISLGRGGPARAGGDAEEHAAEELPGVCRGRREDGKQSACEEKREGEGEGGVGWEGLLGGGLEKFFLPRHFLPAAASDQPRLERDRNPPYRVCLCVGVARVCVCTCVESAPVWCCDGGPPSDVVRFARR